MYVGSQLVHGTTPTLPMYEQPSPARGKCMLRSLLCNSAYLSHKAYSHTQRLAALAKSHNSAVALTQRLLEHACKVSYYVMSTTPVCIMQIMELESARTEAQAEARSLAAELESLRSEGPVESSGVCHTRIPSCERSETGLPSCACVAASPCPVINLSCRAYAGQGSRDIRVHHNHIPSTIATLIFARLAVVLQHLALGLSGVQEGTASLCAATRQSTWHVRAACEHESSELGHRAGVRPFL